MARAVAAWSPVIMTVRTPAVRHVSTASRTSGRGGSIMPTMPTNTRSRSMSSASSGTWGRRPSGEGEHAQRLVGEPFGHGERLGAVLVFDGPRAALVHDEGAAGEQPVEASP